MPAHNNGIEQDAIVAQLEKINSAINGRNKHVIVPMLKKQLKFLYSKKREVLYSGGYGCNCGSTKLLTKRGEIAIEELVRDNIAPEILTFTDKGFKWIQAEVPYLKSFENTLEIKFSNGRSMEVAYNHYFLTTKGWKSADSCVVGDDVFGVGHLTEKGLGSLDDYLARSYLCGEQLPLWLSNVQDVSPLQDGVHGHNHLNLQEDVKGSELLYNQCPQYECHHAKQDSGSSVYSSYDLQQHQNALETCEDVHLCFCSKSSHNELQSLLEQDRHDTSLDTLLYRYAKDTYDSQKAYSESNSPYQDLDSSHSYSTPYLNAYSITEINKKASQKIYDIGVPIYHNYVAEGLIHHNSGKSRTLCYKAVMNANVPGSNVLLVRKTLTSLKGSTLKTLLERDGELDPVLPLGSYSHNKSEGRIDINNGGTITYGGCDNAEKFRSTNFGVILIDEGSQLDKEEYDELLYRLRNNVGEYQQIAITTNPGNPYHFLYERFFKCSKEDAEDREVITASSLDNYFLSAHSPNYIKDLLKMTGARRQRFVEGLWVAADKMVYQDWDRSLNIKHRDIAEFKDYIVALDYGFTHPTGIVLIGVDGEGNTHLIEEFRKSQLLKDDIIKRVMRYVKLKPAIVCDPAAPLIIAELQNAGLNAIKAINDVDSGITEVRDRITRRTFTVEPSCKDSIQELETYAYEDDATERVIKSNDDLVDPIRYAHMYLADKTFSRGAYIYPNLYLNDEEKSIDDDEEWQEVENASSLFGGDIGGYV